MPRGDGTGPSGQGRGGAGAGGRGRRGGGAGAGGRGLGGGFAAGQGGECLCPQCGERAAHQAGKPCYEQQCPKCGTVMTRA